VKTIFTELIYESHIAEIDGHIALVMIIDGKSDAEIVESFQARSSLPAQESRRKLDRGNPHHPPACPDPHQAQLHPMVNMKDGVIRPDWPDDGIFVA